MRNIIMAAMIGVALPAYAADAPIEPTADPERSKCEEAIRVAETTEIGIDACNPVWAFHPGSIRIAAESEFCIESGQFDEDEIDDIMDEGATRFDKVVKQVGMEKTCSLIWRKIVFSIGKRY